MAIGRTSAANYAFSTAGTAPPALARPECSQIFSPRNPDAGCFTEHALEGRLAPGLTHSHRRFQSSTHEARPKKLASALCIIRGFLVVGNVAAFGLF